MKVKLTNTPNQILSTSTRLPEFFTLRAYQKYHEIKHA